jgi:uncharacterized protein YodC (DUF2158 family)
MISSSQRREAMAKFKVGDTVQLKSGGPVMTVHDVGDDEGGHTLVNTSWMDLNELHHRERFKEDMLILAQPAAD